MMAGFFSGLAQSVSPTHVLAIVAFGLLTGQGAKQIPVTTIAVFALGLVMGSVAIAVAMRDPPAALTLLGIAAIAGIVVTVALPPPPLVRNVLAFATGAAVALNSPPQAITIPSAIAAQLGSGIGATIMLGVVAFLAVKAKEPWQRIGVRIVGSWIAASAILVLALRLAR